MKRILIFIVAMCLLLTACGVETEPETQESEIHETETREPEVIEPVIQEEVSLVYTDWSKLTPYEEKSRYSYFEPRSEDGYLQPRDDYGVLLDYTGEIQIESSAYLYGLVTTDGQLVTEPVYSWIYFTGSFILLGTKEAPAYYGEDNSVSDIITYEYFVAASNGSWIRKLESYCGDFLVGKNYLAIKQEDLSLIVLNENGDIVEFPASVFKAHFGEDFVWHQLDELVGESTICFSNEFDEDFDNLYLDVTTGTVLDEQPNDYEEEESTVSFQGYASVEEIKDRVTGKTYYIGFNFNGDQRIYLLDETGKLLLEEYKYEDYYYNHITNGLIAATHNDYYIYFSLETGEVVFSYPIRNNTD